MNKQTVIDELQNMKRFGGDIESDQFTALNIAIEMIEKHMSPAIKTTDVWVAMDGDGRVYLYDKLPVYDSSLHSFDPQNDSLWCGIDIRSDDGNLSKIVNDMKLLYGECRKISINWNDVY